MVHYAIKLIISGIISLIVGLLVHVTFAYIDPKSKYSKQMDEIEHWIPLLVSGILAGITVFITNDNKSISKFSKIWSYVKY